MNDPVFTINMPTPSGWKCYLFGSYPGMSSLVWMPSMGQVPNAFVRFMMRVCFACKWVKEKP